MVDQVRTSSPTKLSRRHFVRNSTIALASLSSLTFLGACNDSGGSNGVVVEEGPEGRWISAACWENCGGRCVNKVLMKDGEIVRQGTDDSHEDSWDWIQQRGCPRGRSGQQICFGEDRLRYPMKRASWEPGNPNGEMRGKDEWVRISWEEATKYIADEMKRIYDDYGPRAVLSTDGTGVARILSAMGGSIGITDSSSCGVYSFDVVKFGLPGWGLGETNDRYDLKNADTIIMIGGNPAWSSGGSTMYNYKQAKDAGVEFIMVGPSYNATASLFESRWIPAYPGTDTALLLAVAYEMIQQDVVDTEFVNKYAVGYDADHMPEGAKLNENFKDYLLGVYDDTPKTAEWASSICGTPAEDIRFLATKLGKDNKAMLLHNYALARSVNTEDIPQLIMAVGAMGGHMGKSGHATGCAYKTFAGAQGKALVNFGASGDAEVENPVGEFIAAPTLWKSILDGKHNFAAIYYSDYFVPEDIREIDIKYVNFETGSKLQNTPDMLTGIKALRTMEFVTCSAHFLDAQAKYSDIVLPLTHQWERVGMFPTHQRSRETLIVCTNVTERPFECKSDQEIGELLCAELELDIDDIYPLSEKQQFFNQILGSTVVEEDGETEVPLVTITQEDLDEWECAGEPQEGKVELKKFLADGVYQIKRSEGDNYGYIGYKDYVDDPEGNPRETTSGKFDIYSDWKADTINAMGYGASDHFKPYPSYTLSPQGREASFVNSDITGAKSDYPFILYNPHYLRRAHPVFDNSPWLREAWPNPVFLSAADAAEKGIASGDTVRVFTAAGATLRTASVLQSMMPGCVALPHGAWIDYDEDLGLDKAGTDNVIGAPAMNGMGVTGYNNINCNYEKYDGAALEPDAELPQRIVDLG